MAYVTGVDGCKAGWFVAKMNVTSREIHCIVCETFPDIVAFAGDSEIIAVDIPIGLLSVAQHGGRECDTIARKYLGGLRGTSVFSAPVRASLECVNYTAASRANSASASNGNGPRLSKQAYMIMPKICEVDSCLRRDSTVRDKVREIHPELSFYEMNGASPVLEPKRTPEGFAVRSELLRRNGLAALVLRAGSQSRGRDFSRDDVLDSGAALWTAERIHQCTARRIPTSERQSNQCDSEGLYMEMWL